MRIFYSIFFILTCNHIISCNLVKFHRFNELIVSCCIVGSVYTIPLTNAFAVDRSVAVVQYVKSSSGISYYDYPQNTVIRSSPNDVAKMGSKLAVEIKGYLAGRNGWQFIDTTSVEDGEIRLVIGKTPVIKGLEIGLIGDGNTVSPMKLGEKRRLVIPSRLGYLNLDQQPIPLDPDNKRRLYNTVFNAQRRDREKEALGDSIVGELILDVQLKRVKN